MLRQTESYDGQLLNESVTEYQQQSHYPGVVSVNAHKTTQTSYELDGSLITKVTSVNDNFDAYGNVGSTTITTEGNGETFVNSTINQYTNDTNKWYLGRLTQASSANVTPQGHATRRLSRFGYNANTGLLNWERTLSTETGEVFQTTWHAYDIYGQENKTTLQVPNEEDRISTIERDAFGRPSKTCNTLNECETFEYNEHGLLASQTGPNGITTYWTYDEFQRKHLETRADGSHAEINYYFASNSLCGDLAEHAYYCVAVSYTHLTLPTILLV